MTETELLARVCEEEKQMSSDERAEFSACRVSLARGTVAHFSTDGVEEVFIVARRGTRVVFFDDVEDEFAAGTVDEHGAISHAGLYGELRWAVHSLLESG